MAPENTAALSWSLVVPVKVLAQAKSRLSGLAGQLRADLALAMAGDTIAAAMALGLDARARRPDRPVVKHRVDSPSLVHDLFVLWST